MFRVVLCIFLLCVIFFFFFKQKTAYEMRISDWSSDVCSSDLTVPIRRYDGEWRWFLSHAVPVLNQDGDIVRWLGTNTDITEQKESEIGRASCRERVCQYV